MAGRREDVWSQIYGLDPSENILSGYENPFDFEDMNKYLDDIYKGYEDIIRRNAAEDITTQQGGTASRMASRGITGGSVVDDTLSGVASKINKGKYNALSQLGIGKAGQTMDLQKWMDQFLWGQQLGRQGQENIITGQKFNQKNMLADFLNQWEQMDFQREQAPGIGEDLMSGLGDIAQVGAAALPFILAPATGGASLTTAPTAIASDIRVKENIKPIGNEKGINIYEFNYIGYPSRKFIGVIADEIENEHPEAVINIGGLKFVNYTKLGIPFRER